MYKSNQFPRQQDKINTTVNSKERLDFICNNMESKMNDLWNYIMFPEKRELLNKTKYKNNELI